MKRKYRRKTFKAALGAALKKKGKTISKNTDVAVFLGVMMSLKRLATAASSRAQETKETVIDAQHIEAVAQDVLASLKG